MITNCIETLEEIVSPAQITFKKVLKASTVNRRYEQITAGSICMPCHEERMLYTDKKTGRKFVLTTTYEMMILLLKIKRVYINLRNTKRLANRPLGNRGSRKNYR